MYFPFISINDFEGWTTLNNFPPNNWEIESPVNSYISCTWVENNNWKTPTPIGFYFAKLWYHERLYPVIFSVAALNRLRTT